MTKSPSTKHIFTVLELNPYLYPPGGYSFKEANGFEVRAADLSGLITAVKDYRKHSNQPEGDAYAEIVAQICERGPQTCRGVPTRAEVTTPAQIRLVARVVLSTNELRETKQTLVKSPDAYARAEVCKLCIHYKEWSRFCPPCKANATELLKEIVRPEVPVGTVAGCACDLAGDDLSVAVWLDRRLRLNDAPAACWRTGRDTDEIS